MCQTNMWHSLLLFVMTPLKAMILISQFVSSSFHVSSILRGFAFFHMPTRQCKHVSVYAFLLLHCEHLAIIQNDCVCYDCHKRWNVSNNSAVYQSPGHRREKLADDTIVSESVTDPVSYTYIRIHAVRIIATSQRESGSTLKKRGPGEKIPLPPGGHVHHVLLHLVQRIGRAKSFGSSLVAPVLPQHASQNNELGTSRYPSRYAQMCWLPSAASRTPPVPRRTSRSPVGRRRKHCTRAVSGI